MESKQLKRQRRHKRIRSNMHGTADRPRLCVFRSNQHIYAQIINDETASVIVSASDKDVKSSKGKKSDIARDLGKAIAKKAMDKKVSSVVFDRGGVVFHGRVKAVAEGAREGGLKF